MAADRLKVIINDRCLRNVRTGVGHYVAELLAALPAVDPGLDVKPFYQRLGRGRFVRRTIESHARGQAPSGPYEPLPDGRGSDVGRGPYARCKWIVEPIFGFIKRGLGFTPFLLNGIGKMRGEWRLVGMACNLRKRWAAA